MKFRRIILVSALVTIMVLVAPQMALAGSGQMTPGYSDGDHWQQFGSASQHWTASGYVGVWSHGLGLQTGGGAYVGALATGISGSHRFKMSADLSLYAFVEADGILSTALVEVWFIIRDYNTKNILWMAKVWSFSVWFWDYESFSGSISESNPLSLSINSPSNNYLFCVEFRAYTSFNGRVCHNDDQPDEKAILVVDEIAWEW